MTRRKYIAATVMSVMMMLMSATGIKAAVADVAPAQNKDQAYMKWAHQITTSTSATLSQILLEGKYIYAADDSNHRIIKINKDTGNIEKQHSYSNKNYRQYYVGNVAYGDKKVYVAYDNGKIEAFDSETLQPLWISEAAQDTVASKLFYDNGHLYYGTGTGTPGSPFGWDKGGKYYVLDTKDEDKNKSDETKKITQVEEASSEGNFYLKGGVKAGKYIVASDTKGKLFTIDSQTAKVCAVKQLNKVFSGGIAVDQKTNTIYFVAGTNGSDLYGIKINEDGSFGQMKTVRVYNSGYCAMTPQLYQGKVYMIGATGKSGIDNGGYFAVLDVSSDKYKVNYIVNIPAYSLGEMVAAKTGDGVRLYFTMNYMNDEKGKIQGGGIYSIKDTSKAASAKLETIYEPAGKYVQYSMSSVSVDQNATLYYSNDSRTIFAIANSAVIKPTVVPKPITKTQTETRSAKMTWKKDKSAKGYIIYAKAGKGNYKKLTTVGKTTKKTVTVKAETSYKFKVKPYVYTKRKGKTVKKYKKAYASKVKYGSKTVKVAYKNVTGYTKYRIYMKVGNGSEKKVLESKKTGRLTLTYTQKKAKVGKSYKFRLVGIKTVNGKDVSKTIK